MNFGKVLFAFCVCLGSQLFSYAYASSDGSDVAFHIEDVRPLTKECIVGASRLQKIPPQILLGLLKTEGGYLGAEVFNKINGSYDLGPMQINDKVWVKKLADAHFSGDQKKARLALKNNGCYNVYIGAWIFRQYLDEAHGQYKEAVGFYHSHTYSEKTNYQRLFAKNFLALFGKSNLPNN